MKTKWFSQKQGRGDTRHRLFFRNEKTSTWNETAYFIDAASAPYQFTNGKKYGLYGSGMGDKMSYANVPYRIAECFGGYNTLREAKETAEYYLETATYYGDYPEVP